MTDEPTAASTPGPSHVPNDHPPTGSRTVPEPRRRKTVLLAVVAMLAIAVPAAAQSLFRDVPSRYVHSQSIQQMREAGITIGCGDGRYCPNDPVTRGAMASFLARGGAQGYGADSVTTLAPGVDPADPNVNGVPVTLDVAGAGESGGRQQVVLSGSVTVSAADTVEGCPCEVQAYIYRARGQVEGPSTFATLPAGEGPATVALTVDWATGIASGRTEQYRIAVFVDGTLQTSGLQADGVLNAVTAPFGRSTSG